MDEPSRGSRAPRFALSALAYRDFRLLIASTGLLQFGIWTSMVISGWMVFHISDSTFQLGLFSFLSAIPIVITTPLSGYLSDRGQRRLIMLGTQCTLAVASLTLAILVTTDAIQLWHFYVIAPFFGGSFSMSGPTRMGLVHDVVGGKELTSAITLNAMTTNVMRVVGPAVGGALIGFAGPKGAFWVPAISYILALAPLLVLPMGAGRLGAAQKNIFRSLKETVVYIRHERLLGPLIALAFVTGLFGMASTHMMPAYVARVLDSPEGEALGWLMSAQGFGALFGAALMSVVGEIPRRGRVYLLSVFLFGALIIGMGLTANFAIAVVLMTGLGVLNAVTLISNNILIQTRVADHIRGRVLSIYFMSFSLASIGTLLNGTIAEWIAMETTFCLLGAIVAASAVFVAFRSRAVREA